MSQSQTEYIDMTPTWEETAVMLVAIMEGTGDTAWARSEIIRMGKIIDHLNLEASYPVLFGSLQEVTQ
jgi:hypothetical protein